MHRCLREQNIVLQNQAMLLANTELPMSEAAESAADVVYACLVDVPMRFLLLHELPTRFSQQL